jgi:membrane protease YdiL (CAAX protease family)
MAVGKSIPEGQPSEGEGLSTRLIVVFYGLLGAAAIVWRLWVDGELPWRHPPSQAPSPLALRVALGIGLGLAIVAASRLATRRTRVGARLAAELSAVLGPLTWRRAWMFALASGLAEEAFFRGALQPRVGLLAATLLFGLAHYVPRPGLRVWSLFALVAGALFGGLFVFTGDLLAPALAHVVVNGLNLHWLSRGAVAGGPALGPHPRDRLDLDRRAEGEGGDADRAAGGLGLPGEVARVDGVESREQAEVGQEDGGLDHRVE